MYTALEHNRLYRIGIGEEAKVLIFTHRDFPEDHPALFHFQDLESGERISFMLPRLTEIERQGGIEYLGASLGPSVRD